VLRNFGHDCLSELAEGFAASLGSSTMRWRCPRGRRSRALAGSLRVNPSSGNLHPTESYLVAGPLPGLHDKPAVYLCLVKTPSALNSKELVPRRSRIDARRS